MEKIEKNDDQPGVTRLTDRDRDLFLAMLDDADARPNDALVAAAKRYKQQVKRTD